MAVEFGNAGTEKSYTRLGIFETTPKGFVIFDTYNNPWYPFKDIVLDNSQYNSYLVWQEFRKRFSLVSNPMFLPFHYLIEIIGRDVVVQATRPITYKSLIPDYEDHISICILGDSTKDVYSPRYYMKIADLCINPYRHIQSWRLPLEINKTIHLVNLGDNFIPQILEKYLKG